MGVASYKWDESLSTLQFNIHREFIMKYLIYKIQHLSYQESIFPKLFSQFKGYPPLYRYHSSSLSHLPRTLLTLLIIPQHSSTIHTQLDHPFIHLFLHLFVVLLKFSFYLTSQFSISISPKPALLRELSKYPDYFFTSHSFSNPVPSDICFYQISRRVLTRVFKEPHTSKSYQTQFGPHLNV